MTVSRPSQDHTQWLSRPVGKHPLGRGHRTWEISQRMSASVLTTHSFLLLEGLVRARPGAGHVTRVCLIPVLLGRAGLSLK